MTSCSVGPYFRLETLDGRQPVLDLLQPLGRRLDVRAVLAQEVASSPSCASTALAALEVGTESGVELPQLRHALPDGGQRTQHGRIVVVQPPVRLVAQASELLGVGQQDPLGGERLVLVRPRRHAVDLALAGSAGTRLARRGRVRGPWPLDRSAPSAAHSANASPTACRSRPSRANWSSRSRWTSGSSSAWCSCWPCRSTSCDS